MSMLIVLVLPAPAYGQGHNMTRQRHIAIGGNHEYAFCISFAPDCHLEQVCEADASKLCAVEAEPSGTKLSGEAREGYSRSLYILSIGKELFSQKH